MKLFDLFTDDMTPNWEVFKKTFHEMGTCKHSERWHQEGSPFNHTKLVTEAMYNKIKDVDHENHAEWFLIMMSAAMLHDIGKPETTFWDENKGDWSCKKHGEVGERIFRNLFFEERLDLREKVAYMIRYHMLLHHTMEKDKERQDRELIQLLNGTVPFEDMLLLNECDTRGSLNEENEKHLEGHISSIKEAVEAIKLANKDNKWDNINKNSQRMYVMIGIPGSGKSTYAKLIKNSYESNMPFEVPIISRDTIRAEMGLCELGDKIVGSKKDEEKVTNLFDEKVHNQRGNFILDNTFLKAKYRNTYSNYAKALGIAPIFVYVEAPSIEDNISRRYGEIDDTIIKKMWDNFEFPNRSECYQLWLVDQRTNTTYKI